MRGQQHITSTYTATATHEVMHFNTECSTVHHPALTGDLPQMILLCPHDSTGTTMAGAWPTCNMSAPEPSTLTAVVTDKRAESTECMCDMRLASPHLRGRTCFESTMKVSKLPCLPTGELAEPKDVARFNVVMCIPCCVQLHDVVSNFAQCLHSSTAGSAQLSHCLPGE